MFSQYPFQIHHPDGRKRIVFGMEEHQQAHGDGWQDIPAPVVEAPPPEDGQEDAAEETGGRKCGICGESGHNKKTCPQKG